jgi:thiamine-monophosphate kinase
MIDVTVAGTVKPRQALTRRGARPGDEIYVSGSIGAAAAGLEMLRAPGPKAPGYGECTARYLFPEPRVRLGLTLSRNRAASACVDLSDGLGDGVRRLAEASGVGTVIDAEAVPVESGAARWFSEQGKEAVAAAMSGGDDYELLFTVRPRLRGRLSAAKHHGRAPITKIGVCTENRALVLRRGSGTEGPVPGGYTHFR